MIPYYVVDAFASKPFEGNPAGVCVLDDWIDDDLMQRIAAENRLSETAFVVRQAPGSYLLRWFTPAAEIDLCGHATFGTAFVLFSFYEEGARELRFHAPYKGYNLVCTRMGDRIQMEFPRIAPRPFAFEQEMADAVGALPSEVLATERDLVLVFDDESVVNDMRPDMQKIALLEHGLSVYVTAPATDPSERDYVARLLAKDRHPRGPGVRIHAVGPRAVLERATGKARARLPPDIRTRRHSMVRGHRRRRPHLGHGLALPARTYPVTLRGYPLVSQMTLL